MENMDATLDDMDKRLLAGLDICVHEYHELKRYKFKGVVFIVWRCRQCAARMVSKKR